jgi:Flp pilus assembly protein TadD
LDINPGFAEACYNLANTLAGQRRFDEAIVQYQEALKLRPNFLEARSNFANMLLDHGRAGEAVVQFQKLLEIKPDLAEADYSLGVALADCGRFDEAIAHYQKAVAVKPNYVDAHYNLAAALAARARFSEAVTHYHRAVELEPDSADARNNLARLLATCPEASIRNGAEAVALAQRAVELSGGRDPIMLDTLAAAYAEAGRFADALQTARQAVDLAARQNKAAVANSIQAKIPLYEAGTPFRQTPQLPATK